MLTQFAFLDGLTEAQFEELGKLFDEGYEVKFQLQNGNWHYLYLHKKKEAPHQLSDPLNRTKQFFGSDV